MEVFIAVAKVKKYATPSSGDTVEVVERPNGGVSVVLADGQSSGRGAKSISTLVVRKVISLLAEGVRDGAAARAASDYLYTERNGKVSSTLNILSVDKQTSTLVITRNNPVPALIAYNDEIKILAEESLPVGLYRGTRPIINEVALEPGLTALVYTDGLIHAGSRDGQSLDIVTHVQSWLDDEDPSPQLIADDLLSHAVRLDQGRPVDDISVVILHVSGSTGDSVRRMSVRLPLQD
jgi:serine phosphatase RsbU (regulator of sigma subunit)